MEIPPMQLASLTTLLQFIICLFYIIFSKEQILPLDAQMWLSLM